MKLTIGAYDVEINAKFNFENVYNDEATSFLLNDLSYYLYDAAIHYKYKKRDNLAVYCDRVSKEIHSYLKKNGFYDFIEEMTQ